MAAVAFAAFFGVESAFAAAMPAEIVKQLSERVPAAFVPVPASGAVKIFPLVSDKRKSPDRKYAITVDGTPFAITAIGEGGKLVETLLFCSFGKRSLSAIPYETDFP